MGNYNLSKILENSKLSENVYDMVIQDRKIAESCKAGQFVELYIDNNKNLLPRPLSICDISKDQGSIRLVYQVLGEGTDYFSNLKSGEKIRLMGPLGNGFTMERRENIAIVGGGVGIPPLMLLLKSLVSESSGANIDVFLGYRDKVFLDNEFKLIRSA
ncbi:MAG: dihydroorotate dehydrogenase electron transfer subunit, partial [Clostridiales bacterium]|nr:dihydroorotate dehydrogenase electron transfer subunit [Clostridiales bacterium]